jgi:hypothetical protein
LLGATAQTARADEHVLVVLDTTGSMTAGSIPGMTRFEVAKQRINTFLDTVPSVTSQYALWTFDGASFHEIATFEEGKTRADIKAMLPAAPSNGVTPLAHSVCAAVDKLVNYLPAELHSKRIFLQTDGEENNTPALDQCFGPSSPTPYPALAVNSWQWKVRNKACTNDATIPGPCDGGASPFSLIVDVDLLFGFVPSFASSFARSSLPPFEVGTRTQDRFASAIVLPPVNADAAFFGGLAQETGGRFTAISPSTPPAVAAPRPGDANVDGCVNVADRALVLQQFGTANPATDFNRDGIVNTFDLQTVLQNFGKGCIR